MNFAAWKIWVPFWSQPDPLSPAFFGLAEPVALAPLHTLLEGLNTDVGSAGNVKSPPGEHPEPLEVLLAGSEFSFAFGAAAFFREQPLP